MHLRAHYICRAVPAAALAQRQGVCAMATMVGAPLSLKTSVMDLVSLGDPWRPAAGRHDGAPPPGGAVTDAALVPEIRPRTFDASDAEGIRLHLAEQGFAVVSNAATPAELDHACGLLWDHLEGRDCPGLQQARPVGWVRGEPETWRPLEGQVLDASSPIVQPGQAGPHHVVSHSDAGLMTSTTHCDCLWFVRSLPGVRAAFASLL